MRTAEVCRQARFTAVLVMACLAPVPATAGAPLPRAHSHNDYEQKRPLLDALDHGFCSVEADIYLVEGELLVAHDRKDLKPERTLQALYLEPLRARVRAQGGRVYPNGPGITLLIDLKDDSSATYQVLRGVLAGYTNLLTRFTPTNSTPGAVTVILSGNRPTDLVAAETVRWCALDGRFSELDSKPPASLVPLVSDSWKTHFDWFKDGKLAETDRRKLRELVTRAHREGRKIRFWGAQDQPYVWQELNAAGVDFINTDKLAELSAFLTPPATLKP
jgi:hypothetical protein